MHENHDPLDRALSSLRSQQWTGQSHRTKLEEELMNQFNSRHSTTSVHKHRTLIASLAVLLIGGVGFAATGGTETVRRIFVTLKLAGPNGEEVQGVVIEMLEEGVDGPVTIDLDMGDGQQGTVVLHRIEPGTLLAEGEAAGAGIILTTVHIDAGVADSDAVDAMILSREGELASMTIEGDDEAAFKTLTIRLGDTAEDGAAFAATLFDEATGELHRTMLRKMAAVSADGTGATAGTFRSLRIVPMDAIRRQIDDSEAVAEWFDDEGVLQELFVLPRVSDEPAAAGFHLVTAHFDENGERAFKLVGNVAGVDPETTELGEIDWDENGLPTLVFITDEGREISLQIDPDDAPAGEKMMIRVEIKGDGETRQVRVRKDTPGRR